MHMDKIINEFRHTQKQHEQKIKSMEESCKKVAKLEDEAHVNEARTTGNMKALTGFQEQFRAALAAINT